MSSASLVVDLSLDAPWPTFPRVLTVDVLVMLVVLLTLLRLPLSLSVRLPLFCLVGVDGGRGNAQLEVLIPDHIEDLSSSSPRAVAVFMEAAEEKEVEMRASASLCVRDSDFWSENSCFETVRADNGGVNESSKPPIGLGLVSEEGNLKDSSNPTQEGVGDLA